MKHLFETLNKPLTMTMLLEIQHLFETLKNINI